MKAVFSRFFELHITDYNTLDEALAWLVPRHAVADLLAIGVYDEDSKILYAAEVMSTSPEDRKYHDRRLKEFKAQGYEIRKTVYGKWKTK